MSSCWMHLEPSGAIRPVVQGYTADEEEFEPEFVNAGRLQEGAIEDMPGTVAPSPDHEIPRDEQGGQGDPADGANALGDRRDGSGFDVVGEMTRSWESDAADNEHPTTLENIRPNVYDGGIVRQRHDSRRERLRLVDAG